MFNFDDVTNKNNEEHDLKRPYILDHPYGILIIRVSGSGKTSRLLNLIKEQDIDLYTGIDKIYLYAEDLNEPKYQLLIKKRKNARIKHLNDPKAFVEYSNTVDDVYNNIDDYNQALF